MPNRGRTRESNPGSDVVVLVVFLAPLDRLEGMSRKGMAVELELLIDSETLSEILVESADEVSSIARALA